MNSNSSDLVVIDNPKEGGAKGRHCTYSIRNPLTVTEVWYYGSTSWLEDRKGKLPLEGKNGLLYVESRWPTQDQAIDEEKRLMRVFRQRHGCRPKFNLTNDGQYHHRGRRSNWRRR